MLPPLTKYRFEDRRDEMLALKRRLWPARAAQVPELPDEIMELIATKIDDKRDLASYASASHLTRDAVLTTGRDRELRIAAASYQLVKTFLQRQPEQKRPELLLKLAPGIKEGVHGLPRAQQNAVALDAVHNYNPYAPFSHGLSSNNIKNIGRITAAVEPKMRERIHRWIKVHKPYEESTYTNAVKYLAKTLERFPRDMQIDIVRRGCEYTKPESRFLAIRAILKRAISLDEQAQAIILERVKRDLILSLAEPPPAERDFQFYLKQTVEALAQYAHKFSEDLGPNGEHGNQSAVLHCVRAWQAQRSRPNDEIARMFAASYHALRISLPAELTPRTQPHSATMHNQVRYRPSAEVLDAMMPAGTVVNLRTVERTAEYFADLPTDRQKALLTFIESTAAQRIITNAMQTYFSGIERVAPDIQNTLLDYLQPCDNFYAEKYLESAAQKFHLVSAAMQDRLFDAIARYTRGGPLEAIAPNITHLDQEHLARYLKLVADTPDAWRFGKTVGKLLPFIDALPDDKWEQARYAFPRPAVDGWGPWLAHRALNMTLRNDTFKSTCFSMAVPLIVAKIGALFDAQETVIEGTCSADAYFGRKMLGI